MISLAFHLFALNIYSGGHDNGYASILNFLNNEGILDKLVLLKGYHDIAYELKALNLPLIQIPNLFLTQRLPSMHQKKLSIPPPVPIMEKRILKFVKKPKGRKEASAVCAVQVASLFSFNQYILYSLFSLADVCCTFLFYAISNL